MKLFTFLVFTFFTFKCIYAQPDLHSQKIVEEILKITDDYNRAWGTADMEKVSRFHSDSSFRYYRNMKLSVGSNEEFKTIFPQVMKGTKSWTFEVINPVVQVLSENAAVIGFTGKAQLITTESQVLDTGTGAYTFVWKKTNGKWSIVHIHESAK